MKKLWILIPCMVAFIFMSCDRRTSQKERLEQAVFEFNKNLNLDDLIHYYPENYTEIKTDSIISNTFKVNIRNYTSMRDEILTEESINAHQKTLTYHRVFESDILVSVEDNTIYNHHISVEKFKDISASKFWENATLEHVWVNQDTSTPVQLTLGVSFINPKDNTYKLYELQIDQLGNERLTLIEDHS